jgi:hypothetical protein
MGKRGRGMKKHIQIKDSYKIWKPRTMKPHIYTEPTSYGPFPEHFNYTPYIIEWWIHNIGYYLTKPLVLIPFFKSLNLRFKDVDLMIKVESEGEG